MIKKYPWNEPVKSKRWWTDADYDEEQMEWVALGRSSDKEYGNIDGLDPRLFNAKQMRWVSYSRGEEGKHDSIERLDPELYDELIFEIFSFMGKMHFVLYDSWVSYEKYQKTLKAIKKHNPEWLI